MLIIWDERAKSVEHFEQVICEEWPWRNLSVGSTGSETAGGGMGVDVRENGLEDPRADPEPDPGESKVILREVQAVDVVWFESVVDVESVELCRDLVRKVKLGKRYVGKTELVVLRDMVLLHWW